MKILNNYINFKNIILIENSISSLYSILESDEFYPGDSIEWDLENNIEIEIFNTSRKLKRDKKASLSYLRRITDFIIDKFPNNKKLLLFPVILMLSSGQLSTYDIKRKLNKKIDIECAIDNIHLGNTEIEEIEELPIISMGTIEEYLDTIAYHESRNNPHIVKYSSNKTPMYIGKYQFSKIALKDVGLNIDMIEFDKDSDIWNEDEQDDAMKKLLKNNWHYLRNYHKYEGSIINGFKITKAGMLAGAHLTGQSRVKAFLSSNGKKDEADGNGIKTSTYMKRFANYEIN